ncbi:neural-cadherin-like [Ambystoma mexicanum]|uniref:neural-cadherin-like n=1 Tax=Ambystoma mexicanum TaxID=8296 RepID=UPI0037E8E26C
MDFKARCWMPHLLLLVALMCPPADSYTSVPVPLGVAPPTPGHAGPLRLRRTPPGRLAPFTSAASSCSHTARVPAAGGALGETIFTVPDLRYPRRWFEIRGPPDPPVRIESGSGRVFLTRRLQGAQTQVLVKVQSLEQESDWYLCHLTIIVPQEESLQWTMYPFPYLACVDPAAEKGASVYQLLAHYYHDESSSDGISYLLVEGGEERFVVDRETGAIVTTGLPLAWNKEYALTVQAIDRHANKSPCASISILAGTRAPQFTNMSYSLFVPENTPAGERIAVVEAVSFQKKALSYTLLLNPSGLFRINQESGELGLTHAVDFESEHHLYHILVKALEAESGLSSVTEVMIHITDDNDCAPEFLHSIYSQDNIPETVPVGTSLLQVQASDCDTGSNSELSYFTQSSDFSITPQGVISSSQCLNYERINHVYEFVVIAVDKGFPPRTGTASVRIRMTNVNDEAPVFSQTTYRTFLAEDAGPNTLVATVHAKDPDGDSVSYLIAAGNEEGNFELDSQKGILKLRRSPLPRLKGPQYVLNITAVDDNSSGGPSSLSSVAQVIVGINDVNNNKPVFGECAHYSEKSWVLENQPPGTFVLQVEAHDEDLGLNGEVKYGIMHRDGAVPGFSIHPDTGVISTAQVFDREKQRDYAISVTATDQAHEPLIGVCQITVLILDVNDNDPKFENSRYQYFLREDTQVGTSFLRAAALDDDQGVNAAITYSLSQQQPEYLQINPSTGWVYVSQPISQTSQINRYIIATDGGNRSSSVELTVTITNVLNQPPQWEQPAYWVTIPENTMRDTKIVIIKAISPLGDPRVTYNLEEGQIPETNMPVRFYLKPNRADGSASILVAEPLDFETTKFFTLRVRAQNVASVPLASFTTVYINITDVNDNVPFFTSSTYEVTTPEGAETGTPVAQVLATDLDSGLHGEVQYVLLRDPSGDYKFFTIDAETGVISTQASFDREKKGSYLIEVQSQDSSESARPGMHNQPNTDTAYVRVFISDVNDNAPAFPQSVYEIRVEEGKDVGYVVMTVTANDEDEEANAKLRYQITSGNAKGTFDVEPEVGTIFIAQGLDYEEEQRYELRLVASDGKWENQTLVIIDVMNENDEAPVFTMNEYHDSVFEELTDLPVLVLQVSATDPDQEADQSALRYSLHGQGANSEFIIDEFTGNIYVQKKLDREKRAIWRFLVLATDENGEGLTGFADVIIEVRDVNDNPPVFLCISDGCFMGSVLENSPADTTIMEMTAIDLDDPKTGKNAVLTYRIVQNARNEINLDLFSINTTTGALFTVLGSLDREKHDKYLVMVEASDGEGLTGTGTATILVSDVNDHAPTFTQKSYTAFIPESAGINSEVAVLSAGDRDEGENAMMTFSIVHGDDDRRFFMETDKIHKRGIIRLRKRLDFEKPHERTFNLTVKVEDLDFYNLANCIINVEDSNDHAPLFFPPFYEAAALLENVPLGTPVAHLSAIDLDSGLNGMFSYHILNESDPRGQFAIDREGCVRVEQSLDRETVAQHRLLILATDMGQPALTGTATILVTLLDINDNGPEFEAPYSPVVWENTASPHVVHLNETSVLLHATDRDSAVNGAPFSFHLDGDLRNMSDFSLQDYNNGSAALIALRTFDREEHKAFFLPIVITDSGSPPMSSTNTLTVTIGDRNDHPHNSGHMESVIYSYEGVVPTTALGKVQAPDLDDWEHKRYRFEGKPSRYFILSENSGQLSIKEGTAPGVYNLRFKVTDGFWPDMVSTAKIIVREITAEAARNAGSVRIAGISAEEFIAKSPEKESKYNTLERLLSEVIPARIENIHLFSVLNVPGRTREIDVWFAAHGSPYYQAVKLEGNVAAAKEQLDTALGVHILQIGVSECATTNCSDSTGCVNVKTYKHMPTVVTAGSVSLASVTVLNRAECICSARESQHLSCASYPGGPCLNGGTCVDTGLGYKCECPTVFHGPECQQTQRTFTGHGYAWFPTIDLCFESRISVEFVTEVADGLLLYIGPMAPLQHGDAEDLLLLELKNGAPSLTVNHGSGSLLLQFPSSINVADRLWHSLQITSNGKKVQMILDHCSTLLEKDGPGSSMEKSQTTTGACEVSGETPGNARFLNVYQPFQLGGTKRSVSSQGAGLNPKGFKGCIRNLIVDSKVYDLESPAESLNSAPGCALTDAACRVAGMPACGAHGLCLSNWGSFSCDCHPGFSGGSCSKVLPEWSFAKDSWIDYQLSDPLSTQSTLVQLMVRTRTAFGTILMMSSIDARAYIKLEVAGGHFSVRFSTGDKERSLAMQTLYIDHGQWVLLSMERHGSTFTLRVNNGGGDREVTADLGERRSHVSVGATRVILGNSLPVHTDSDFQGCMRDVRLNGQSLPFSGESPGFSTVLSQQGTTSGCLSDACSDQPCQSPFRCADLWRKYECRCPLNKVEVTDTQTGVKLCSPSPCGQWSCRNGGTCVAQSQYKFVCHCAEGYKGRTCEISLVKGGRPLGLNSGSILAISMCLLVFIALLVSYTVWSQWGRSNFRKGGVYHIPVEHESWEDIRENILNYNEEGGGEHDQNAYDMHELKRPLRTVIPQTPMVAKEPHQKMQICPKKLMYSTLTKSPQQKGPSVSLLGAPDFREYVSQIIWEADNDPKNSPTDLLHVYCLEGHGSLAGSLSSLASSNVDEDLNYDYLKEWGSKFDKLKELYEVTDDRA